MGCFGDQWGTHKYNLSVTIKFPCLFLDNGYTITCLIITYKIYLCTCMYIIFHSNMKIYIYSDTLEDRSADTFIIK